MRTDKEIMVDRRVRGIGYISLGIFLCLVFIRSVNAGFFDGLKHLNSMNSNNNSESGIIAIDQPQFGNSPEGEALFKANCNSCHLPHQDATGPALKGAKERWIKNSNEQNFYDWIRNSDAVVRSGDPYAIQLKKKWPNGEMTPQNLSNEQIDEIFTYIN